MSCCVGDALAPSTPSGMLFVGAMAMRPHHPIPVPSEGMLVVTRHVIGQGTDL